MGQQGGSGIPQRADGIEPPFARRHVQWTVAVIASLMVSGAMFGSRPAGRGAPHRSLVSGQSRGSGPIALLEIDLNVAEARELELLPGVGPVLAQRIVENRRRLGPFRSLDELTRVPGVGPSILAGIRSLAVIDPPWETDDPRLAAAYDAAAPER
jgi:competence ComEA-like helix-hairpin-helix protein